MRCLTSTPVATLRDARLDARLTTLLSDLVRRPSARITQLYHHHRDRTATYRFLNHQKKAHFSQVERFIGQTLACSLASCPSPYLYIVLDKSSFLPQGQPLPQRGLGPVQTTTSAQGYWTLNAVVLDSQGQMHGLLHQHIWARPPTPVSSLTRSQRRSRCWDERESHLWWEVLQECMKRLKQAGVLAHPIFVIDAEADCAWLFEAVLERQDCDLIVRVAQKTRVDRISQQQVRRALYQRQVEATYTFETSRPKARQVGVEVKFGPVTVTATGNPVTGKRTKARRELHLWMVQAQDAKSEEGWQLLCTQGIETVDQALAVVLEGYSWRWSIERFHHGWKQVMEVEKSWLRSEQALKTWMHVTAGAAVNIEYLMTVSREEPGRPALELMERALVETIQLVTPAKEAKTMAPEEVEIGEAVRWLAQIGGYVFTPSQGPPGHITISRGMESICHMVAMLSQGLISIT